MTSYLGGLCAEDAIARHYHDRGGDIAARRWRGARGEIDIVARQGDLMIFVEVKRAKTHARAAERVRPAQVARLQATAEEYCARTPGGAGAAMRFDVALVDGAGRIDVLENAFM